MACQYSLSIIFCDFLVSPTHSVTIHTEPPTIDYIFIHSFLCCLHYIHEHNPRELNDLEIIFNQDHLCHAFDVRLALSIFDFLPLVSPMLSDDFSAHI